MAYFVGLDPYELHQKDKEVFNNFILNARALHFTYDTDSWSFKKYTRIHM